MITFPLVVLLVIAPAFQEQNTATTPEIVELLAQRRVEVRTEGAGITGVRLGIRRLVNEVVKVDVPVGTFFVSEKNSVQNMVATVERTVTLENDLWQEIVVSAACANHARAIPGAGDHFTIQRSPQLKELQQLMPVLRKANEASTVTQAAVWIVTDNTSYDGLGTLSRGGIRSINHSEAARAMEILDQAGIDLTRKAIWMDSGKVLAKLEDTRLKNWLMPAVFDRSLAGLKDPQADVRERATKTLAGLEDIRAYEPLLSALRDESGAVRSAAALGIRVLREPKLLEPLIAALKDENFSVRMTAVDVLYSMREPKTVEPFIAALADGSPSIREKAAHALGDFRDPRAREPLAALLNDTNPTARLAAITASAEFRDPRAVDPAIAVLKEGVWSTTASVALGRLGDARAYEPLVAALKNKDYNVRSYATDALGRMPHPGAFDAVLSVLNDQDTFVRESVAQALGSLKDRRAFEPLVGLLNDKEGRVRAAAASALGQLRDPRGFDPLVTAFKSNNVDVSDAAVSSLLSLNDSRTNETLLAALRDQNDFVRMAAASALAALKEPRAAEPLLALLMATGNGRDRDEFEVVANALSLLKYGPAVEPLIAALRSTDWVIQNSAAIALGEMQDPRAAQPLLELVSRGDSGVRWTALSALVALNQEAAITSGANRLSTVRYSRVAQAIGTMKNPGSAEILIGALADDDPYVRAAAATAMRSLKDPRGVEAVIQSLSMRGGDASSDAVVERALGALRNPRAIRPLLGRLRSGFRSNRWTITLALREITGEGFGPDSHVWDEWWETQDKFPRY